MKKFLLVVTVLAITAPAFAAVDVNCTVDGNEVTVQFVNTDPNHVRAFALDIILDNASGFDADWALKFDANVVSIDNLEPNYWVYPGSIDVNTNDNSINSYGSAVADDEKYPDGTLPGLDSNGMTVEMASLYYPVQHNHANAPPDSGVLFTFKVDTCCNLTIRENAKRGGIVMEDGNSPSSTNLPYSAEILVYSGPQSADFTAVEEPNCWCACKQGRQCRGDADGRKQGKGNYWVATWDLDVLIDAWQLNYAAMAGQTTTVGTPAMDVPWICADFDHTKQGKGNYRVATWDLDILIAYWQIPSGPDANCP
jgi:hypothetical protein